MSTASVTYLSGAKMLYGIKGRSLTAGRLREVLGQLLVEFPITSRDDEIRIRQAATLAVISDRLQARYACGDLMDLRIVRAINKALRKVLTDLRQRNGIGGPALPSTHERLASFHEMIDPDDDGDDGS